MTDLSHPILFETDGPVAIITLNRPENRNAVNVELTAHLRQAVKRFEEEDALRVAILTGAGKIFCSGMDLAAFLDGQGDGILFGKGRFAGFVDAERTKPVIAAVEGAALAGGMEIALACDLIVAGESAVFGLPEVGVGLFPVAGGAFRLAGKISPAKALQICLTGEGLSCQKAYDLGLVNEQAPDGKAMEMALNLARKIAMNAPLGVRAAFQIGRSLSRQQEAVMWDLSENLWADVAASVDAKEGPSAFKERRKPVWSGR